MAIDYQSIADGALAALADVGQPVTLHVPSARNPSESYTPGGGVVPSESSQDIEGTGAVFGYKASHIDGTRILQGDQYMLLAPQIAVAPQVGWMITASGATYSIKDVQRVAPAGVVVLYKLQLRGA